MLKNGLYNLVLLPKKNLIFVSEISNKIIKFHIDPETKNIIEKNYKFNLHSVHTYFDSSFNVSDNGSVLYAPHRIVQFKCIIESFKTNKVSFLIMNKSSEIRSIQISELNRLIIYGSTLSKIRLHHLFNQKKLYSLDKNITGDINFMKLSSCHNFFVAGSQSNNVYIFKMKSRFEKLTTIDFGNNVFTFFINIKKMILFIGGWNKSIQIKDLKNLDCVEDFVID